MKTLNTNLANSKKSYLFPEIQRRVALYLESHPERSKEDLISLGIGDVALPLAADIGETIRDASHEMEKRAIGYGPECGDQDVKEKICLHAYSNLPIKPDELFISEGINNSLYQLQALFSKETKVAVIDPAYPVYASLASFSGQEIITLQCREENNFCPELPPEPVDLIYLCSPNNPTGCAMNYTELKNFVDYALEHEAIIIFDSAYESFITSEDVPHSIYEIEGANKVAIELRSFSKSAGFSGLRLGYTVVPKTLLGNEELHKMYTMIAETSSNGACYLSQQAACTALGSPDAQNQVALYQTAAKRIRNVLEDQGFTLYGGVDAPYLFLKVEGMADWEMFDFLIEQIGLITIPGSGFGNSGNGFIRLSSFISGEKLSIALMRLSVLGERLCQHR